MGANEVACSLRSPLAGSRELHDLIEIRDAGASPKSISCRKPTPRVTNIPDLRAGISVGGWGRLGIVIRQRGANSISMGRTPHEMYDERCCLLPR